MSCHESSPMMRLVWAWCTTLFYVSLLSATQSVEYGLCPITFRSFHILSSHLFLGLPLCFSPEMVSSSTDFGNLPFSILLMCPYHLKWLLLAKFSIGRCLHVISQSILFLIISRGNFARMILTFSFLVIARLSECLSRSRTHSHRVPQGWYWCGRLSF